MKKNIRKIFIPAFFGILAISLAIGACFSPYGADQGTITINVANSGRWAVEPTEILLLSYEVTLDGPGGRQTVSFSGGTVTVRVAPGTYRIVVRAYGDRDYHGPSYSFFPPIMLRGRGVGTADIRPGKTNTVRITMTTALEIFNGDQLHQAVSAVTTFAPEIFIIKDDFQALDVSTYPLDITGGNNITLIAEESRTIDMRFAHFSVESGSSLTLGQAGMGGTLTLDGYNEPYGNSLIRVQGNSQLVMNYGVILQNRLTTGNGGGVYSTGGGSTFTMNGGTIMNNITSGLNGGGVFINSGAFYLYDGIISGNKADASGGGIFISSGATFRKTGGIIYGINAPDHLQNRRDPDGTGNHALWIPGVPGNGSNNTVSGPVNFN